MGVPGRGGDSHWTCPQGVGMDMRTTHRCMGVP
jgi:hypothetical protein